jgi:tetratricopeptide (TPR) repeat protein
MRQINGGTLFDLLGVTVADDRRELKRAYFRLSKEFHPDRYYKRALGSFGPWLNQVFESISRAFEVLGDDRRREAYLAQLVGQPGTASRAVQSRAEHVAELFTRACEQELRGDLEGAIRTFSAVVRMDPQPRYFRRAALCCLGANALGEAEEYARKGKELRPNDPAYARVLAEVLRAGGNLDAAEETLLRALELRTENDVLVGELRADLAAVRAARTPSG